MTPNEKTISECVRIAIDTAIIADVAVDRYEVAKTLAGQACIAHEIAVTDAINDATIDRETLHKAIQAAIDNDRIIRKPMTRRK